MHNVIKSIKDNDLNNILKSTLVGSRIPVWCERYRIIPCTILMHKGTQFVCEVWNVEGG